MTENKPLVIFAAGGRGTRIQPLNDTVPKPMIPIAGKPMLQWGIEGLVAQGYKDFIITVSHLASIIIDYFGDGSSLGCKIEYFIEEQPIVVTDQPVIARGEVTIAELELIHSKMETLLGGYGAYLDGTFICPHHPHSGFRGEVSILKVDCNCRKPKPGLLLKAAFYFNIDLKQSWMIGDSWRDIEAGKAAGCKTVMLNGEGTECFKAGADSGGNDGTVNKNSAPTFAAQGILAAVKMILK